MIQILNIETIKSEFTEVYCVAYSKDVADHIHYTNFDTPQMLHYIQNFKDLRGVQVHENDTTIHIINYLEQNFEKIITEMILNNQ